MNAFVTPDQEAQAIEVLAKIYREAWLETDALQDAFPEEYERPHARSRAGARAVLEKFQEAIKASPIGWRAEWKRLIEYIGENQ